MNKRNIFLWTLYDFANSIVVIVFFLYFSQWLVIDNKVADLWFNLIFVGSTLLLILTAPIGGSITDKIGVRMPLIRILTILMAIGLLTTSILANFMEINKTVVFLAALSFLLANYFYQFSLTLYNTLLKQLAPPDKSGFISGIGLSGGWIGQLVGLLITLPLVTGTIILVGHAGRSQTFLPSTILFILLSLPMLLFFREVVKPKRVMIDLASEYKNAFRSFINLCKSPGVGRYLLGYFFFNDAVLTASNNFPIYMQQVFGVSDKVKSILTMGMLITIAIGALVSGWLADKIGLKRSLIIILAAFLVFTPLLGILTDFKLFSVMLIVFGFIYGATWTVTRAIMSYLAPPERLTHAFSYYTLAERFATFVGPVTWGLITYFLINTGTLRYRVAVISMTIFILIGFLIVRKIPAQAK